MNIDLLILKYKANREKKKNTGSQNEHIKYQTYIEALSLYKKNPQILRDKYKYPDEHTLFPELINLLVKSGVDINMYKNKPALFITANKSTLDSLLKNGANVNILDKEGRSALFYSDDDKTKLLIKSGININLRDKEGNNALFVNRQYLSRKIMIENNIDAQNINNKGENIFFKLHIPVLEIELYEKKSNLNQLNILGENFLFPLMQSYRFVESGHGQGENTLIEILNKESLKILNYQQKNNNNENIIFFMKNDILIEYFVDKQIDLLSISEKHKMNGYQYIKNNVYLKPHLLEKIEKEFVRQEKQMISENINPEKRLSKMVNTRL